MIKSQGLLLKFEKKLSLLQSRGVNFDSASSVINTVDDMPESIGDDMPESIGGDTSESKGLVSRSLDSRVLSEGTVREQSKIYGKLRGENAKLTAWQDAVNAAAYKIATRSPDKMYDRSLLKIQAEEEARRTFVFKKKSGSRSKYDISETKQQSEKRKKLSSDERAKEIRTCSLELQCLTAECRNKEKQVAQANDLKDYALCAGLHKELRILLREKQQLTSKLSELQKKEGRHLKYLAQEKRLPLKTGENNAKIETASGSKKDITSFFNLKSRSSSQSDTRSERGEEDKDDEEYDEEQTPPKRKKLVADGADKTSENDHANVFELEPLSSQSSTRSETHPVVIESSDEDDKQTTPKRKKVAVDGADRISEDDHANVLM
jgi:hypothetical protein